MEVSNTVQETVNKTIPKRKKMQEVLQIAKRSERQRIKGKIYPTECRVPKISQERERKTSAQCIYMVKMSQLNKQVNMKFAIDPGPPSFLLYLTLKLLDSSHCFHF